MDGQFITNKELILSDIINSILPKCDKAYFLIGYFYFSGYAELCNKLEDVNLKILVGLDVERSIINGVKEVEHFVTEGKSKGQTRDEFYKTLVDLFNNTDFFDSEEQIEKFKMFLGKIEVGTLEIRKTMNPNHAKMYLFQNKEEDNVCGTFPGTMITGSSNLSVSGLKDRLELNAIFRDKPVMKKENWFSMSCGRHQLKLRINNILLNSKIKLSSIYGLKNCFLRTLCT